jgi:hypothetical protein
LGITARVALIAAATAGLCACAVSIAFQVSAERAMARTNQIAELAVNQPILAARVGPLAAASLSEVNTPGERARAMADLANVLSRIAAAHDALTRYAADQLQSEVGAAIADVDAPMLAFLTDANALADMAGFSPAGAERRMQILSDRDAPALTARLHDIARAVDGERAQAARRSSRLGVATSFLAMIACALGVATLIVVRRVEPAQAGDAQAGAPRAVDSRIAQLHRAFPQTTRSAARGKPAPEPLTLNGRALVFVRRAQERTEISKALSTLGLEVEAFDSLETARAAARDKAFELIVLDSVGAMFAGRIKAAAAPSQAPILAIADSSSDARTLRSRGVDVTVRTPIEIADLEAALAFVLRAEPRERSAA